MSIIMPQDVSVGRSKEAIVNGLFYIKGFSALCHAEEFTVKGQEADEDDFGNGDDVDPCNAPDYGCGNRHFTPKQATQEVLVKYGITEDEYKEIASALEEKLSFGRCALCS